MDRIQVLKNTVYLENEMLVTAKERIVGYKADEVDARIQELEALGEKAYYEGQDGAWSGIPSDWKDSDAYKALKERSDEVV